MATGKGSKSANDSIEQFNLLGRGQRAKRAYVTRRYVKTVSGRLNGREWAILRDVGRLGVASGKHLQRLHYGPSPAGGRLARKHLGELIRWQVLTHLDRSVGGVRSGSSGYVYALGVTGQRLLEPDRWRFRPPWTPGASHLRHALSVSELYVQLREAEKAGSIDLLAYDTEPQCWRRYFGPGGARSNLKPDSLAVVGLNEFEDRYFIELDLGTESGPRITTKAKAYVRYFASGREQAETGVFPYVLWVAPNPERADLLMDALARVPAEYWRLFQVTTTSNAVQRITDEASQSISNQKEVR
jgi:hypothetical protein